MKTRILMAALLMAMGACTPSPTSDFTVSGTGHYGILEEITFRSTALDAATLHWDFGDGQTATGPVVTHQYEKLGSYTATLTAVSENGKKEDVSSRTINIEPRVLISFTLDSVYNEVKSQMARIEVGIIDSIFLPQQSIDFDLARGLPQTQPLNMELEAWGTTYWWRYSEKVDTAWVERAMTNVVHRWIDTVTYRRAGAVQVTYYLKP